MTMNTDPPAGSLRAELLRSGRRHRARQVRARIVELAQEYKEACRQHEQVNADLLRLDVEPTEVLLDEEERTREGMEQRREALFAALEELAMREEEGQ